MKLPNSTNRAKINEQKVERRSSLKMIERFTTDRGSSGDSFMPGNNIRIQNKLIHMTRLDSAGENQSTRDKPRHV